METDVVRWIWDIVRPIMDPYRFGSIAKCSMVHALVEMLHEWYEQTDDWKKKNFIQAVLVDYSKAFDRINPNILLEKLKTLGIPVFLLHWIFDFLSDRSQAVKVGNATSNALPVWGTVPQGTKLGVVLFILMINDLKTGVPTFKYVDDTTIYSITNDTKNSSAQEAMDTIMSWSNANNMKINAKKTKEMLIFFSKVPPEVENIIVNGEKLERAECVTLLGLRISNKLTWEIHVNYIVKRGQQRLFCLTMLRRARVAPKDIVQIYCSKIRPVMEYACPVWHGGITVEQSDAIEHVQERAMRIAYPSLDYCEAIRAADIPSLQQRRVDQCKALFTKMQDPNDKLFRILPPPRNTTRNTRSNLKFPLPKCNTDRFKDSFLPYCLYNCQI